MASRLKNLSKNLSLRLTAKDSMLLEMRCLSCSAIAQNVAVPGLEILKDATELEGWLLPVPRRPSIRAAGRVIVLAYCPMHGVRSNGHGD